MNIKHFLIYLLFIYSYHINLLCHNLETIFTNIYLFHGWAGKQTASGSGSDLENTREIRKQIPNLLRKTQAKTLIDVPCGDFWWMKEIDLSMLNSYIGIDIVKQIIENNNSNYANSTKSFLVKDVSKDPLPFGDVILCRDLFLHLPFSTIFKILKNFKASNSKYLLTSTYLEIKENIDRKTINKDNRPINLQLPPFNFPKPIAIINEKNNKKYLALWKLKDLNLQTKK